ncbi:7575_t:CDS:2 [Funneliformis caledonium]|uniref:7575_t:CDS:1 n=1 Tax=Funneliformis caledonium TaxID=1117310 RepID=A0A9N8ZKI1_9GLOM|nr:7575_t:CDS:2 [Funneliformis caledonium]
MLEELKAEKKNLKKLKKDDNVKNSTYKYESFVLINKRADLSFFR